MHAARALVLAFVIFAAAFALHIVGGATDQGWLFAIAVGLIYLTATGYPAIAAWLLDRGDPSLRERQFTLAAGAVIAIILTTSALRAANDRTFAWWQAPLALVLVTVSTAAILGVRRARRSR
ncbi:MAG: hypothetical protein HY875_15975 [Chloroflexi bacterium]|nr:hypothetical protein [Chloroflexota bacterium]